MTVTDPLPEFDDELLSAYLDNELAPEERARVERWLAADPAARQLLDQLRSVSSAVCDLPRESVGTDLSETILQRAERAMLTSQPAASAAGGNGVASPANLRDPLGDFTVGRTRRGWIWAGAAIAAALLVAAFEMGPQQNKGVPGEVAKRAPASATAPTAGVELQTRRESASDSASQLALKAPAPSAEPPRAGGLGGGGVGTSDASGGALAQNAGRELRDRAADDVSQITQRETPAKERDMKLGSESDHLAVIRRKAELSATASAPATSALSDAAAPPAEASAKIAAAATTENLREALEDENAGASADLLVVHVTCSPEALRDKKFESVLASNGILVEDADKDETKEKAAPPLQPADELGKQVAKSAGTKLADKSAVAESAEEPAPEPEVIVVDAPVPNVFSCLDAIDKDKTSYLNIGIDDGLVASNKKVAEDARAHRRGLVPQQQPVQVTPDNIVNVQTNRGRVAFERNYSDAADSYRSRALEQKQVEQNVAGQGRAYYVEPQGQLEGTYAGKFDGGPGKSNVATNAHRGSRLGYALRSGERRLDANTDGNLQVMFMLWPSDQPASSSSDQPASSPPIESKVSK